MAESNYTRLLALGIDLKRSSGQTKVLCPKCSHLRSNKLETCLSVNIETGEYNCHNGCGFKGNVSVFAKPEKVYAKPQWTNTTGLSDNVVKWFAGRKISQQTLNKMFIVDGKEFMPQVGREASVIKFPYIENGQVVNVKYRGNIKDPNDATKTKKIFKMVKDAKMVFYNIDAIKNSKEALIVEGEPDCLSFIEAGYDTVVSVPNGGNKGNLKLEYLDNCWQDFENKEKIYIGTDNDETGIALRNELVRRLGDDRCYLLDYKDVKDGNAFLNKYGEIELVDLIKTAPPVPIEGIFMANDLLGGVMEMYENGLPPGMKLGLGEFDKLASFAPGQLTTITGLPSSGKSEFLDYICHLLAVKHGWRFGVFSPENFPIELHMSKLTEKIVGKRFGKRKEDDTDEHEGRVSHEEIKEAVEFLHNHFYFIRPKDENYSLDNILLKLRKLILKYGINSAIIDPWNYIEQQIPQGVSETSYINNQLSKMVAFTQRYNMHLFLVAHPTKIPKDKKTGKYEIPTLYTISGSAHFYNRTHNGITIYRDFDLKRTIAYVQKWKFKHQGKVGDCKFVYHWDTGRYNPEGKSFDLRNHLHIKNWDEEIPAPTPMVKDYKEVDELLIPSSEIPF